MYSFRKVICESRDGSPLYLLFCRTEPTLGPHPLFPACVDVTAGRGNAQLSNKLAIGRTSRTSSSGAFPNGERLLIRCLVSANHTIPREVERSDLPGS